MNMFNNPFGNGQQNQLQSLMNDPAGAARQKGWDIPQELMGNPQAMVMHLIQTGQVGGPMIQQIMPILQRMGMK